jgi:hypothetical protein
MWSGHVPITECRPGGSILSADLDARPERPNQHDKISTQKENLAATKKLVILAAVNGGAQQDRDGAKVPLGIYKIRGAFGPTWYGENRLFGPDTTYFKLVQKVGKNDEFTFRRIGNQVNGYVRLIKQVAGNLETPEIQADDF